MANAQQGRSLSVRPYLGDNKTLLAFNFDDPGDAKNLAGFSIECKPPGQPSYYLLNELQFAEPSKHAQVAGESPHSTVNAPIQKYRWIHVPGTSHQGLITAVGTYVYTVTPRYFDASGAMQALESALGVSMKVPVGPFRKGPLALGFTRGYMQSEAFAHHFGTDARLMPQGKPLLYDTTQQAGTNPTGEDFTFADEYAWLGATARRQIFALLDAVLQDPGLALDVFAYDLNEPDILKILLALGKAGRVRIILDNAKLHVTQKGKSPTAEDQFTQLFQRQAVAPAEIVRGSFARYSHDKILIVSKHGVATQVLTGSTNFSVTGLYVNANHVLVFDDAGVAAEYAKVFEQSWKILKQFHTPSERAATAFSGTPLATTPYQGPATVPRVSITFSPHTRAEATKILAAIAARIESQASAALGNVLFAVMQLTGSETPVYQTLNTIYANKAVYSYGISDAPDGVHLYAPGSQTGVLVTGKPGKTTLPAPFDQVPPPPGHEIHDKFIVCGLNGDDPVVYCGSSNLATGGEMANGDNLLEIHDADVAAVFAIEALLLVDHYNFLDRYASSKTRGKAKAASKPRVAKDPQIKQAAAQQAGMFLYTDDAWSLRYFQRGDLHFLEREIFAKLAAAIARGPRVARKEVHDRGSRRGRGPLAGASLPRR